MNKIPLSNKLRKFGKIFYDNGYTCYLVGGAVRNSVAGLPPSDFDFTTDATPREVIKLFRNVIPTGMQHGTVTVLFMGESYEVTTFRVEGEYTDSRHPDSVAYTSSLDEDLLRRDFTINSIAADLKDGTLVDPNGGQDDICKKIIRCIGIAEERFNEDALRILRLFRFQTQLEFSIENESLLAAAKTKEGLKKISAERINSELVKILKSNRPSTALKLMEENGILEIILPEVTACKGISQNGYHSFDVFDHLMVSCDAAPKDNLVVRLAALLHDVGKPQSKVIRDGVATFYNHEQFSAKIAQNIMKRLKFSNKERDEVVHLVREHMFHYTDEWSDKAVRRFISRVGVKTIPNLFALRLADSEGHGEGGDDKEKLNELSLRIKKVLENGEALSIKELEINGNDLIEIGLQRGPQFKVILKKLLEQVLDNPNLNNKESLIKLSKEISKEI